jgi:xanthine dehydrogenase accessory factor
LEKLHAVVEDEEPVVIATIVRGHDELIGHELFIDDAGQVVGTLGNEWDGRVLSLASQALSQGISRRVALNDETEIFMEVILPPPTLILVGGVHIAEALISLAKSLGYRIIVIDPRKAWGNKERFPIVDQLIQMWPDKAFEQVKVTRSTAIAMLTHDPKLDDPALQIALNSPAFYVGALGSKSTNAKRRTRLLNDGVSESQLTRLHAPIGLDIGAETPEEIALAIMSEVVNAYRKQNQPPAKEDAKPVASI